MAIFKMHNTFFVFLRCTIGGGQKVDVFLIVLQKVLFSIIENKSSDFDTAVTNLVGSLLCCIMDSSHKSHTLV